MKSEKQTKVENYLKEWGSYLDLSALERHCKITPNILSGWLKGRKYRLDKYVDSLDKLFTEMSFCY